MKKGFFKKALSIMCVSALALSYATMPANAKILENDGVKTLVDPTEYETNKQYVTSNVPVRYNGGWLNSSGKQFVFENTDSSISEKYVEIAYDFGSDFWTEENKKKAVIMGFDVFGTGTSNTVLQGGNGNNLTTTWQSNLSTSYRSVNSKSNEFNRVYYVYYLGDSFRLPEYGDPIDAYACAYDVYVNGQSTICEDTKYNWQELGNAQRYPETLKVKLYQNGSDPIYTYISNVSVYVADYDKVSSIVSDFPVLSDTTGGKYITCGTSGSQTVTTEYGYLGKDASDASTHAVSTAASAQTFNVPEAFWKADKSSFANEMRYLVFGAQFVPTSNDDDKYITYMGLMDSAEYFTSGFSPWNASRYQYTNQWNQIYIVYDRFAESTDTWGSEAAMRGKTYIYLNGEKVVDGLQRNWAWCQKADEMTKVQLFAEHALDLTGNMDIHWDNVEMYLTNTLPDFTDYVPELSATATYTISDYEVTLSDVTTVADIEYVGTGVRAYKGGNASNKLADTDRLTVGDTISVDNGTQVRQYKVVADTTPVDPELINVIAYSPMAGNSLVISWINPKANISNAKLYLDGTEQTVDINTSAEALNSVNLTGLEAGKEYTVKVCATMGGENKEYTVKAVVGEARGQLIEGISGLKSKAWYTVAKDYETDGVMYYANTVASIANDGDAQGNYATIKSNLPVAHSNTFGGIFQNVLLEAESAYILKFKAKSDDVAQIKVINEMNNDDGFYRWDRKDFNIDSSWKEYTYIINEIDATSDVNSNFMIYNEDNTVGTVCVDDVELYYYDSADGALTEFGNLIVQGDFENLETVLSDPTFTKENDVLNVKAQAQNAGDVTFIVALYDGNKEFKGLQYISKKDSMGAEEFEVSIPYSGDWDADNYSAKVMWFDSLNNIKPLRNCYTID